MESWFAYYLAAQEFTYLIAEQHSSNNKMNWGRLHSEYFNVNKIELGDCLVDLLISAGFCYASQHANFNRDLDWPLN